MTINSEYYQNHANEFISDTLNCDMSVQYAFFEKYLLPGQSLMDLGCGSGRDSRYFKNRGYDVTAVDPTEAFCQNTRALGIEKVYQLYAQQLEFEDEFDGIWACASLLHVPSEELGAVFGRCCRALKENGVMYVSFKYGSYEGERNGREFTDLNEELLDHYLENSGLKRLETLISEDVRPQRTTRWLNAILKKEQSERRLTEK